MARGTSLSNVLALVNQKGGVGKTTTAINVASFMASKGKKVLLMDIDPQANATSSLGVNRKALPLSIYDSLIRGVPITEMVILTKKIHLVPSSSALAGAQVEMVHLPQREYLLRRALEDIHQHYHYIFIDCPPSLGLLTINALAAARRVLIPVQCEYLSLEGLGHLLYTINLVRRGLNPHLEIFGLVMTMYDPRTRLSQQVVEEVRKHFSDKVFTTIIPRSVRLSEAPSYGDPISIYAPSSSGGMAYEALTEEILERMEGPTRREV